VNLDRFHELMSRPAVARELFLPDDRARWDGENYTLGRGARPSPTINGLRIQEPDPNQQDDFREKACQEDLARIVRSLMELRKEPSLGGLVLSGETLIGHDAGQKGCKRVLFGMACPADGRFRDEASGAAECHRVLVQTFSRAGFRVRPPDTFNPAEGLQGLARWADTARFERDNSFDRRWLLALLPLLLLLLPFTCNTKKPGELEQPKAQAEKLFDLPVDTESFLILVDKSGSMKPYFDEIRKEAKRLLDAKRKGGKCFANVIVYDGRASSALGKIDELTDATAGKLGGYLDVMEAGGGTNLRYAIDMAVKEVADHGKRTTLLVLTDGEDSTIGGLVQDKDKLAQAAGPGGMVVHTTTPRLFQKGADPSVRGNWERGLKSLSEAYSGQFGPRAER